MTNEENNQEAAQWVCDLTPEEAAAQILAYFSRERVFSSVGRGVCRYRTPDGRKCAVGCLIPDSLYSPEFEGKPVPSLVGWGFVKITHPGTTMLLTRAQRKHDALSGAVDKAAAMQRFLDWLEHCVDDQKDAVTIKRT